jgi:hypothetical protein
MLSFMVDARFGTCVGGWLMGQTIFIWWYLRIQSQGFIKLVLTTSGRSRPCLVKRHNPSTP